MTRVVLGSDSAVIDLDRARRVVSDVTRRARQLIRWQSVRTDEERLLTVPPPVQRSAQSVLVQRVVDPTSWPRPDHERPDAPSHFILVKESNDHLVLSATTGGRLQGGASDAWFDAT